MLKKGSVQFYTSENLPIMCRLYIVFLNSYTWLIKTSAAQLCERRKYCQEFYNLVHLCLGISVAFLQNSYCDKP